MGKMRKWNSGELRVSGGGGKVGKVVINGVSKMGGMESGCIGNGE